MHLFLQFISSIDCLHKFFKTNHPLNCCFINIMIIIFQKLWDVLVIPILAPTIIKNFSFGLPRVSFLVTALCIKDIGVFITQDVFMLLVVSCLMKPIFLILNFSPSPSLPPSTSFSFPFFCLEFQPLCLLPLLRSMDKNFLMTPLYLLAPFLLHLLLILPLSSSPTTACIILPLIPSSSPIKLLASPQCSIHPMQTRAKSDIFKP